MQFGRKEMVGLIVDGPKVADDEKPKEKNMNMQKLRILIMASALFMVAQAYASVNISSLDTGADKYSGNYTPNFPTDPNWTVSLLPPSETPGPGGSPTGAAYLVPNNIWPVGGPWMANDSTSTWITYANPQLSWFAGGDLTGDTYQYQLKFTAPGSGSVAVNWSSDNESSLYVNGSQVGLTTGSTPFGGWTSGNIILIQGQSYTVDLDVINDPQGSGNPTGGRVEFSGNLSAVPEPATLIAGVLLLLPFGASTLRILRRNRVA